MERNQSISSSERSQHETETEAEAEGEREREREQEGEEMEERLSMMQLRVNSTFLENDDWKKMCPSWDLIHL